MRLIILSLLVAAAVARVRYDGYSVLGMTPSNADQLKFLGDWMHSDGLVDFWLEPGRVGAEAHVMVPPAQRLRVQAMLSAQDIQFHVVHKDVQVDVDRELERMSNKKAFDLNEFNTYEDIMTWMDDEAAQCADNGLICDIYSIGTTYEGRDLRVFHLKTADRTRAHWVDSAIHAREWLAPATVVNMMHKMLHEPDGDVDYLLNGYEFYFMPVMNPDGYQWTFDDSRLWRKNRAPNDNSACLGTDLNRNYDYNWGEEGVSHLPCADTYCGDSAGSELETQAVQAEAARLQEKHSPLASWLTVHAYGNMWMWPWGNTVDHAGRDCEIATDHDDMAQVGEAATKAVEDTHNTNWAAGTSCIVIYETTGATDDYVKGAHDVKYPICPEIRGNGFIVNEDQIQPSYEEMWNGFVAHVVEIEVVEGW